MSVSAASPLATPPSAVALSPQAPVLSALALPIPFPFPFSPAAAAIPLVGWAALVAWVYQDATARESGHPLVSALTVTVAPPLIVAYVSYRGERTEPQSDRERLALTVLLAILAAMIAGTVLSPPDVFAQPRNTFGALLLTLPLFYALVYRDDRAGEGDDTAT